MPIGLPFAFNGQTGGENFPCVGLLTIRVKQAGIKHFKSIAFTNFTLEINCERVHADKLNHLRRSHASISCGLIEA